MSPLRYVTTCFVALLLAAGAASVHAQITVTEPDARTLVGGVFHNQSFTAQSPEDLLSIFDQSGASQTYDFRPFDFSTSFPTVVNRRDFDAASMPDMPLAEVFDARGANVISVNQVPTTLDPGGQPTDSTVWIYERIDANEAVSYGIVFISEMDADQDGDAPDTLATTFDPARLNTPFPTTFGTEWMQTYDQEILIDGVEMGFPTTFGVEAEVVGYGTLHTAAGSAEVLQVQQTTTQSSFGGTTTTTAMNFISENGRLTASITRSDDTNSILSASYTVFANEQSTTDIPAGTTPTVSNFGMEVEFTQNSSPDDVLFNIFRYQSPSVNQTFSGSATSDDGTTITPTTIWNGQYHVIEAPGLSSFTANVCLETASVPGVNDPQKLIVVSRANASQPWMAKPSVLNGTQLCTNGVTSFSQFGIASDAEFNPLPVELTHFTATVDGSDALVEWETASETNNAGFALHHRAEGTPSWQEVAFVAGAGTTTEAHTYRYRVADLAAGTHAFRLQQVDHSGATTLSDGVEVRVAPTAPVTLKLAPNPMHGRATATLTLREAQAVRIDAFDLLGRRVRALHDGPMAQGITTLPIDAQDLPSGRYLLRIEGTTFGTTQSFVVVH